MFIRKIIGRFLHKTVRLFVKVLPKSRASGLVSEINWWRHWFATKGDQWPEAYIQRLDPETPLQECCFPFIDELEEPVVRILDIGSGPLTKLGKKHPSKNIEIVATDVLSEKYDILLNEFDIDPPVRTQYADAEKLTSKFEENSFNFIHACNCVDHMKNPLAAIKQMILVVKQNCYIYLIHAENEGKNGNYGGLHQWDFTIENNDYIMRYKNKTVNVCRKLGHMGDFDCKMVGDKVVVNIRKI